MRLEGLVLEVEKGEVVGSGGRGELVLEQGVDLGV
jgi:hypothetical protein